jgi:hypothetical protein
MTEPTLQESDIVSIGSKEDNILPKQDVKSEVPGIYNESAERDYLDESRAVYDPKNDIYNPFIIGIKFWQAYSIACISPGILFRMRFMLRERGRYHGAQEILGVSRT